MKARLSTFIGFVSKLKMNEKIWQTYRREWREHQAWPSASVGEFRVIKMGVDVFLFSRERRRTNEWLVWVFKTCACVYVLTDKDQSPQRIGVCKWMWMFVDNSKRRGGDTVERTGSAAATASEQRRKSRCGVFACNFFLARASGTRSRKETWKKKKKKKQKLNKNK